jgi:hypothetical protein
MIKHRPGTHTQAQALLEITILASVFLFFLSMLVRLGVTMNARHGFMIDAYKDSLAKSVAVKSSSLVYAAQYFKNIRIPDPSSPTGTMDLQELTTSFSSQRSEFMNYPQGMSRSSMSRQRYSFWNGTAFEEVDNPVETGEKGFTTEGWAEHIPFVKYTLPKQTACDGASGSCSAATVFTPNPVPCFIQRISDPDDMFPSDNLYWSWIAVCGYGLSYNGAKKAVDDTNIPFLDESCVNCLEDYEAISCYTSDGCGCRQFTSCQVDTGQANDDCYAKKLITPLYPCDMVGDINAYCLDKYPCGARNREKGNTMDFACHPGSSADQIGGSRSYGDTYLSYTPAGEKEGARVFFQSMLDPSVPLDAAHIFSKGCASSCTYVKGTDDRNGKWIEFDVRDLPDTTEGQPLARRGLSIYVPFSHLAQYKTAPRAFSLEEAQVLGMAEETLYTKCYDYTINGESAKYPADTPYKNYNLCGAEFRILALEGQCGQAESLRYAWNEQDDGQTKYKFNILSGMTLSHSAWGDLNLNTGRRMADQGIREYRMRSDVDTIEVRTDQALGKTHTRTKVKLQDTITRKVKTNPYGLLNGTDYYITQNRTLDDDDMYNYTVQE